MVQYGVGTTPKPLGVFQSVIGLIYEVDRKDREYKVAYGYILTVYSNW